MNADRSEHVAEHYAEVISLVPQGSLFLDDDLELKPKALNDVALRFMNHIPQEDIRALAEHLLVRMLRQIRDCRDRELEVSYMTYEAYAGLIVWRTAIATDGYTDNTRKEWSQEFQEWLCNVSEQVTEAQAGAAQRLKEIADYIQNEDELNGTSPDLIRRCIMRVFRS